MYQWTPKGYQFVEQDDIDPDPVYAVGEERQEPAIDPSDPELWDNWLDACDYAHWDAQRQAKEMSVWEISPNKHMIAVFFPVSKP